MTSLNSQESSNDISKLTDKQQAEYHCAYQEYIAQMAQLEMGGGSGREKPVQPQPEQFMTSSSSEERSKDGAEQDGRKSFNKRSGAKPATDSNDFVSNSDGLDPITEEDEKGDHGSSKSLLTRKKSADKGLFPGAADLKLKAGGLRYQKLTSDDEESEESDNAPLLKDSKKVVDQKQPGGSLALKGKDYLSDATLDKKDSSDSGVRSNESSPNHSLQDEEAELSQLERSDLIELDEDGPARKRGVPGGLSGLQDPAVARMSICSEDQCSLLASSPDESWPSSRTANLNRTPSNVTLNNNNNTNAQPRSEPTSSISDVIVVPTATRPAPNNENVRVVHLKRGLKPGDPPEVCTVSSDTVAFGDERESIL